MRFGRPTNPSESYVAYWADTTEEPLAGTLLSKIQLSSSETDTESETLLGTPTKVGSKLASASILHPLYTTCLKIRDELQMSVNPFKEVWPPLASELNIDVAENMVPISLYNAIAWITGKSSEPTLDAFVAVDQNLHLRILSICQDLIFSESNGNKSTPKHYSLGIALKHITGSTRVITLLNKFGHCASRITISSLENALAQIQASRNTIVPEGFRKGVHVIIPSDNIDFCEETESGKGTTHHTNSVIIQRISDDDASTAPIVPIHEREKLKKRKRLEVGRVPILLYEGKHRKIGPPVDPCSSRVSTEKEVSEDVSLSVSDPATNVHSDASDSESDTVVYDHEQIRFARKSETLFFLMRYADQQKLIPSWTAYKTLLERCCPVVKDMIGYLPVIPASSTEVDTIFTVVQRAVNIADELDIPSVCGVYDMAIYIKVQAIRWANLTGQYSDLYWKVVPVVGQFHTCMVLLGVIGTRFGSAGLTDLLVASDLVAEGSLKGVISGKHYNRGMACYKIAVEALESLRFEAYINTLPKEKKNEILSQLKSLNFTFPSPAFEEDARGPLVQSLIKKYDDFCADQCEQSKTFAFWSSFINLVKLLLKFITSIRTSSWNDHLSCYREMMPWIHAYDRIHYARYTPAFLKEMNELEKTHPFTYKSLASGNFTAQQQDRYCFSAVAPDHLIEQTINRDCKTAGGWTGFTLNPTAVQRWILSQPQRALITRQCEQLAGLDPCQRNRKDHDRSRQDRDRKKVIRVREVIGELFVNPFDSGTTDLLNICSGAHASEKASKDLINAYDIGKKKYEHYAETLDNSTDALHAKLSKLGLETFAIRGRPKRKDKSGTEMSNTKIFARFVVLGKRLDVDLRTLLSFPLGPVSFPLASSSGGLAKTQKSQMLHIVESKWPVDVEVSDCVTRTNAYVQDLMALIHGFPKSELPNTWGEFADTIFAVIQRLVKNRYARVDVIADTYPNINIKCHEHKSRAASTEEYVRGMTLKSNLKIVKTQFKNMLSSDPFKEALIEFLVEQWLEKRNLGFDLYIGHGKTCHAVIRVNGVDTVCEVEDLKCNHVEADTRIFLHCHHASTHHFRHITINTPDSDIAFIGLSCVKYLDDSTTIYMRTGGKQQRLLNLTELHHQMGDDMAQALVGLQVFTGVDSTSAFIGKGKKRGFDIMVKHDDYIHAFGSLGSDFQLPCNIMEILERFCCRLYGETSNSVNEARYRLFCSKSLKEERLPPCYDALVQHALRSTYQCGVWRSSLQQHIDFPDPAEYGWKVIDDSISVIWSTSPTAPPELLKNEACSCKKSKCVNRLCSCHKNNIMCTDFCSCTDCENIEQQIVNELVDDDSESDNAEEDEN